MRWIIGEAGMRFVVPGHEAIEDAGNVRSSRDLGQSPKVLLIQALTIIARMLIFQNAVSRSGTSMCTREDTRSLLGLREPS